MPAPGPHYLLVLVNKVHTELGTALDPTKSVSAADHGPSKRRTPAVRQNVQVVGKGLAHRSSSLAM